MKRIILMAVAVLMGATSLQAQKTVVARNTVQDDKVYDICEQMPEFPGGMDAMWKFMMENMNYPKDAQEKKIEGRVIVQFIVRADGSITDTKVIKKVCPSCDAEAMRVVNAMPKWKPGMQQGKPVNVKYTMPVAFRLN